MSWDDKQSRWVKMYKGQRYTVACSVLGVPATKEQSYQAANRWWEAKRAEVDAANRPAPRPPLPLEDLTEAWAADSEDWQALLKTHPQRAIRLMVHDLARHLLNGEPLPQEIAERLPPARLLQVETAVAGIRGQPTAEPEKTVEAHADLWLKAQQQRAEAGQMSPARVANNRTCLEHFKAFVGPQAAVAVIDAERLEGFYLHCLKKMTGKNGQAGDWSVSYARDVFSVAKSFIGWLAGRGAIDQPKNLGSKSFKFGSPAKGVETWSPDEFRTTVAAAPGKLKLALLLMANCGMTQEDISELRDTEVDWQAGRVIRKRTKTAHHENVPTVDYLLWPTTFALLRQYRSGQDRVLLTERGEPYVRTRLKDNGKLSKADGFASCYVHLKKRLGFDRPLKELRKLGATLLAQHPDYGRFHSYFLGHSPRTVADRHYVQPPQALFHEAIRWLGVQLGQVATDQPT
jgi:integrase